MVNVRQWSPRCARVILHGGMLCAGLSIALAAGFWRLPSTEWHDAQLSLTQARAGQDRFSGLVRAAHPGADTFVTSLPSALDGEQVVQRFAATALLNAVALTDSRIQAARVASDSELPRATLTFSLRGSYAGIKATLADILARTANATLQSLTLRRDGKSELEAQVLLSLWLRPASVAAPVN